MRYELLLFQKYDGGKLINPPKIWWFSVLQKKCLKKMLKAKIFLSTTGLQILVHDCVYMNGVFKYFVFVWFCSFPCLFVHVSPYSGFEKHNYGTSITWDKVHVYTPCPGYWQQLTTCTCAGAESANVGSGNLPLERRKKRVLSFHTERNTSY